MTASDPPNRRPGVSRRTALTLAGAAPAVTMAELQARPTSSLLPSPVREIPLSEGTNIAVAVSPDGRTIAFDLLGLLWVVPIEGGTARCLTDAFADIGQPAWSPDGDMIAFQSYRSGNFHIWTIKANGSDLRQRTTGFADHREPSFSPDGRSILHSSDRSGRYAIHLLDLESGTSRQLSHGTSQDSEPCFSPDGTHFAYIADGKRVIVSDLSGIVREIASVGPSVDYFRWSMAYAPGFAPDGRLAYTQIANGTVKLMLGDAPILSGEDIYPFRPSWTPGGDLIYAAEGQIRRRNAAGEIKTVPFAAAATVTSPAYPHRQRDFASRTPRAVIGIGSPVLSPDGKQVAFRALNDIYLLTIGDPHPRKLIVGPYFKCDPAWSPDGRQLAYATDKGGTLDIWLHDIATGAERQVVHLPDDAATSVNWSPDGRSLCFLDHSGALHVADVATGTVQRIYDPLWEPGRPSFGPDGRRIALAAFKPSSARYREGLSEVLIVDRETGKGQYRPIAENRSIATRGDDGPVWSPDGRYLAYIFASTLWVQPVDGAGAFVGEPRQLTRETSDAPSWSGDGKTLLYLHNGKLRLISVDGGTPHTIPFAMTWALAAPAGRKVVCGARVWDAIGPGYREADVVLVGNRIGDIVGRGHANAADMERIDGAGLTLMPGLIDMHTHRQMQGYGYGDRMGRIFLAMGITATRSPGCPAYHMVEDREAIDAGLRTAPRHFATGEAIDGSRIYYNFMRPVTEPDQLALELARAEALSYDMIKTYVRLDHATQAEVIRAAHGMGVHASSHYHYPALRNGMDGVEHLGATSRFGYSRTQTALGSAYHDVSRLFAAAKAGRTPTLFSANVLIADDPALLDDPRIQTLFPPWEYAKLKARYESMAAVDRAPLMATLERNVRQIRDMMALGWHVHSGTDAPIDLVAISLHLNLRGMTRFGISPFEALLTATRHAGEFLHEPLGTIASGQLADLILVEGDPLARVEDVARIRRVVANGIVHDMPSLLAPFRGAHAGIAPSPVERLAGAGDSHFWHEAAYLETGRHACCAGHILAHDSETPDDSAVCGHLHIGRA